jgi:hypothetical protein
MSGGAILRRASDEFVGSVEALDQAGGAEARDGGRWKIEGVEREPRAVLLKSWPDEVSRPF